MKKPLCAETFMVAVLLMFTLTVWPEETVPTHSWLLIAPAQLNVPAAEVDSMHWIVPKPRLRTKDFEADLKLRV